MRRTGTEPPSVTVVEILDPTNAGLGVEVIDMDAVQLASAPFRARRVVVRLEGGVVVYQATEHRVRTRTRSQPGMIAFVTFGPETKGMVNGVPIRADLTLAVEAGTEVVFVSESGYESVALLLPAADLRGHLRERRRERELWLPRGVEIVQKNAAMARRLFDWGRRLVETAESQPALFDDRKEARVAARVEMVETLLSALGTAKEVRLAPADRPHRSAARIVKEAEDYALSHARDHVYVGDLCRAAGVSERALQYAFKHVIGVTPVAFLIRLRLHRVRRALLAASPGSITVSSVALDWGFWHLGEFSRAYKECFGELPSDTLRREPDGAER